MGLTKKKEDIAVAYEEWVNAKTGEVRTFAVSKKDVYHDTNFYKVFLLDFLGIAKELGKGKINVMFHILENIEPATNTFIGRFTDIQEATGSSSATVSEAIKFLLRIDFFRKKAQSVYMVSPQYLLKGKHDKRMGLMRIYNSLPHPTKD